MAQRTTPFLAKDGTRRDHALVGTTYGLARATCDEATHAPEQVYVYRSVDPMENPRPIVIDGWVGYTTCGRLRLTRRQARELMSLLVDALLDEED